MTLHPPIQEAYPEPVRETPESALARGATVLTASPRAARFLHLDYARAQRSAGHTFWPSPPIFDWDSWLRGRREDYAFSHLGAPLLLTPLQEQALWTRVQHDDAARVLSPTAMAALAMEAWSLLSAFEAHGVRRSSWSAGPGLSDAESFRRWAAAFEEECARNGWLSASQIELELMPHLSGLELPAEVCLVGFDRITPARRRFLAALAAAGCRVTEVTSESAPEWPESRAEGSRRWLRTPHLAAEIEACASWARDLLEADPLARIGVLVPSISDVRGLLDRAFRRVLLPESEDIRRPATPLPWEFSLGQPLADVPAVRAALLLLRWTVEALPQQEISWLLLSGFPSEADPAAVARYDAARRRAVLLVPEHPLATVRQSLAGIPALRSLYEGMTAVLHFAEANQLREAARPPSAWTELVPLLLDAGGWPGARTPDTVHFQALQRWRRLLDELALLDYDGSRCTFAEFLAVLEAQAREAIFAPESHDAPVQILGPFESSGQRFDALWFLQTDDTHWPQRGRLHPLLPGFVQRQYGMPHATSDDDQQLARTVTARLLASAPVAVFSCSEREKDAELRPSPLMAALFPPQTGPEPVAAAPAVIPRPALDPIPDERPPSWPSQRTPGGADVLRRQAACPFQAFAVYRLGAQPLESPEWGLNPAEKGKVLHAVLESVFRESIHSLDDLVRAAADGRLPGLLDAHIAAALSAHREASGPQDCWQQSYLDAEARRLRARLLDWLAVEAIRQPFVVEACEQRLEGVQVGGLSLHLRADRIDRLPDGSRLVIDYKTGSVQASAWRGERPDEPQLPLYAAYGNVDELSGVLLARIRAGETAFDGRVRDARAQLCAEISPRRTIVTEPYSEEMRDAWAAVLRSLAVQFLEAEAAVDPREAAVCEQCGLHSLCRIAERDLSTGTLAGSSGGRNGDASEDARDA